MIILEDYLYILMHTYFSFSVLVHCSDGWDRTPQIVSLAQLMLDPYYRSIDGFRTLVEICWLDFGHKMADRNGTANGGIDPNERAPIFIQVLCATRFFLSVYFIGLPYFIRPPHKKFPSAHPGRSTT